jgi:hypothetical protein
MIKSAILASAICFAFVVPASAQQTVTCDQASLTKMRTDIDAITDPAKKAKAMESWTAADTAFKANNLNECNARIGDASTTIGVTGSTGTTGSSTGTTTTTQ